MTEQINEQITEQINEQITLEGQRAFDTSMPARNRNLAMGLANRLSGKLCRPRKICGISRGQGCLDKTQTKSGPNEVRALPFCEGNNDYPEASLGVAVTPKKAGTGERERSLDSKRTSPTQKQVKQVLGSRYLQIFVSWRRHLVSRCQAMPGATRVDV